MGRLYTLHGNLNAEICEIYFDSLWDDGLYAQTTFTYVTIYICDDLYL